MTQISAQNPGAKLGHAPLGFGSVWKPHLAVEIRLIQKAVCYRESSQIQFTSQLLPPSGENDCSIRAELGEMLSQT